MDAHAGIGGASAEGPRLRPNAATVDDPGQARKEIEEWLHSGSPQSQAGAAVGVDDGRIHDQKPPPSEQSIIGYDEPIMLTQSTHSFLFTEPAFSIPWIVSLVVLAITYTCLILALLDNLGFGGWSKDSIPANVAVGVKIAQYLALFIGLIMEGMLIRF